MRLVVSSLEAILGMSQVRAGGNGSRQISLRPNQIVATGRGLYIRRVRSEYSSPFVFSPRVISPRRPWNRTESWGDTDLGEVAEPAPPTSDGSEGKWHGFPSRLGLKFIASVQVLPVSIIPWSNYWLGYI